MAAGLDETKRLIEEGHAAILKVTPSRDDDSAEAFQCFRRGVTRADGSHELQLLQLEQKQKVLSFLVDFAQKRRSHRRQVSSVVSILMKDSSWQQVAKEMDILSQLPDEPLPEETKEAGYAKPDVCHGGPAKAPLTDDTALGSALLAFQELKEIDFECETRAANILSRFAQGVALMMQWQQEDLAQIDALEPKLPMLRLLCQAHHDFQMQRDQLMRLLQALLNVAALDRWRVAALSDFEVSTFLGRLRVAEPVAPVDGESSPDHAGHDGSSEEEEVVPHGELKARWMWQDAGRYAGPIGVGLAKFNPTRWSPTMRAEDIIADLQEYLDGPSASRPVRLELRGSGGRRRLEAASVAEAMQKLIEER